VLLDILPVQTTVALQAIITSVSRDSLQAKQNGVSTWWRSLEASLACINADSILDVVGSEEESGKPKSFDVELLLSGLIPSLLTETSKSHSVDSYSPSHKLDRCSFPARQSICIRKQFHKGNPSCSCLPVPHGRCECTRVSRTQCASQSLGCQGHPKVSRPSPHHG